MKLSDVVVAANEPQHVLVFGDSKTGKTQLAGQLAKRFKLHWFDLEHGYTTLLKLPAELKQNITLYPIPDTRSYPIAIETMLKVITGAPVVICEKHGKVACLSCPKDGLPTQRFCLNELGPDEIFVTDSGTQLGNSAMNHLTRNAGDDYKPDWDDYRRQGFMLDRFLSNLQQGRYHAVVLTHTTMAKLEGEKTKLVPVMGTDNFSRNVAKYFDHVVYCDIGTGKHTQGSSTVYRPQILTGSRTDVAIEKDGGDTGAGSLIPFFDGTVKKVEQQATASNALQAAKDKAAALAGKTT